VTSIAAILCFGPPALPPDSLDPLLRPDASRGSEEFRRWQDGKVGLALRPFRTSPGEACGLTTDPTGPYGLAADLRLDNREELRDQLNQAGTALCPKCTDAEMVLAGYQLWGTDLFSRLVGDFALVLWDAQRRQLLCARDAIGLRPLFYHADRRRFVCGSTIRQVLADPGIPRRLSEQGVADYLSGIHPDNGTTFFDGVSRLPAGHWLAVEQTGRMRRVRFWAPTAIALAEGKSAEWYADGFRVRFLEAVRARLRTDAPRIGVHVSGGFDSSAVVAAVHQLNQQQGLGLQPWAFLNIAHHPAADERPYMQEVLARHPMPVETTTSENYWAYRPGPPSLPPWRDEPYEGTYHARLCAELEAARARGIQVILTGIGGDEVGGNSWYLVDLLLRGKILRFWPEWQARAAGKREPALTLLRVLLGGLTSWARRAVARVPRSRPPWIDSGLLRRLRLPAQVRHPPTYKNPARNDIFERLQFCCTQPLFSAGQDLFRHFGVEMRHPFLDRRLIEWALAVPPFRFGEDGRVKAPLRRALADLLPRAIIERSDKGNYLYYWDLGLRVKERTRIEELFRRPLAAELGYVDAAKLRKAYAHYCAGGSINRAQLWATVTLEAWLRQRASSL
jgi:asparagine synthase (glutamine-hydrolysing)